MGIQYVAMDEAAAASGGVGLLGIIIFGLLIIMIGSGIFWGWAVKKIVQNKGYRENWFWWGFFFKFFAFVIALTKPDLWRTTDPAEGSMNRPQSPQILYCASCGKQMEAGSRFCKNCGAKTGA